VVGETCLHKLVITLLAIGALALAGCKPEAAEPDSERACALKLFPKYSETLVDQCMAVCKTCGKGNTVTCSTSCKLKGAS
jgi:hypothetical protein